MMVKMYRIPSEDGRGPTKSTCRELNQESGSRRRDSGARTWRETLDLWHWWHALARDRTSADILYHTKRRRISLSEDLPPGWCRSWKCRKILSVHDAGTRGLSTPVETSQRIRRSRDLGMGTSCRSKELSGPLRCWNSARAWKCARESCRRLISVAAPSTEARRGGCRTPEVTAA